MFEYVFFNGLFIQKFVWFTIHLELNYYKGRLLKLWTKNFKFAFKNIFISRQGFFFSIIWYIINWVGCWWWSTKYFARGGHLMWSLQLVVEVVARVSHCSWSLEAVLPGVGCQSDRWKWLMELIVGVLGIKSGL